VEQLVLTQEQQHTQGKPHLNQNELATNTVSYGTGSLSQLGNRPLSGLVDLATDHPDLEEALLLSASYFSVENLQAHNEAAFYTITTQGLALCKVRENVSYRLRLLHNLALYYYTKAAPNLRHLKRLEDVLELSPKQRSIATCNNNLAFMRLSANILATENPEQLAPFETKYSSDAVAPIFTTTEIELK